MPLLMAALLCGMLAISWDLKRRRLALRGPVAHGLVYLDMLAAAALLSWAVFMLLSGLSTAAHRTANLLGFGLSSAMFIYLWGEGRRAQQFQRPDGIVAGQFLVLAGIERIVLRAVGNASPRLDPGSLLSVAAGGLLIAVIVARFLRGKEEHRIIERFAQLGESYQDEWTPSTPECPRPDRWTMFDSMSAEIEVLDFLKQIVLAFKPALIVETGTFIGASTIRMAEALRTNGSGKIVSCEYDPVVFAKARERIDASGLAAWVDCRNESSLEMQVEGAIDLFFSDSHLPIREDEIRRFLPQINSHGLIVMHDTSSHFKIAREAAFRLEKEGLISMLLLPTPRGLMVAQKRNGS